MRERYRTADAERIAALELRLAIATEEIARLTAENERLRQAPAVSEYDVDELDFGER